MPASASRSAPLSRRFTQHSLAAWRHHGPRRAGEICEQECGEVRHSTTTNNLASSRSSQGQSLSSAVPGKNPRLVEPRCSHAPVLCTDPGSQYPLHADFCVRPGLWTSHRRGGTFLVPGPTSLGAVFIWLGAAISGSPEGLRISDLRRISVLAHCSLFYSALECENIRGNGLYEAQRATSQHLISRMPCENPSQLGVRSSRPS